MPSPASRNGLRNQILISCLRFFVALLQQAGGAAVPAET